MKDREHSGQQCSRSSFCNTVPVGQGLFALRFCIRNTHTYTHTHLAKYDFVYPGFLLSCSVHKFHKPVLKIINRVKSACAQCSRANRWTADCHAGHTQKTCPETRSEQVLFKPTRRTLSLVGTFRVDPKRAPSESRKCSHRLPLSHSPGHFQENRSDPPSSPSLFPTSCPLSMEISHRVFWVLGENHVLTHAKEINPMCLQSLRYKLVAEGWPFPSPWKLGLLQPMAGTCAVHRALPTPTRERPACCRTCCVCAQQTLSHRPEVQWLDKLFISCAVPNIGHLYETHLLRLNVDNAQSTYIWSKKVNKPGNALLPWFTGILCGCALQSNIMHGKSCLIGNCPRKLSKNDTFPFRTSPPSFTARRATAQRTRYATADVLPCSSQRAKP